MPIITISNNTGADYAGTDDCTLQESTTTTNDGGSSELWVHSYGSVNRRNTLIRFTLPAVLVGATINSVSLDLYCNSFGADGNSSGTRTLNAYRVLLPWTEGAATWDSRNGSNNWNTGGCRGSTTDRAASTSAALTTGATGYVSWTGAGMVSDVAAGFADWVLERNDFAAGDTFFHRFVSSEGADGQRPRLVIDYTAASGGLALPPFRSFPRAILNH